MFSRVLSLSLIRYVLTAAVRDRVVWGVVAISLLAVCLSLFTANSAIIEKTQFAIVFMAGSLRLLTLFGLLLFVVFFIRRSFDARDVEFLLTRPISRSSFVLSFSLAFSLMALVAGAFLFLLVGGLAFYSKETSGIFLWAIGVSLEYVLVVNTAFFFAMVLSSPVSAGLATMGFYILSRMMGQLLAIVHQGGAEIPGRKILSGIFEMTSVIIPRFDLMTQTSWLIYGGASGSDWLLVGGQGAAFLFLVLVATLIDLSRRQF